MHDITLTSINDSTLYEKHKRAANADIATFGRLAAQEYVYSACKSANYLYRMNGKHYTAEDILSAALELADYYKRHLRETLALASADEQL
jgi:hypothetical protein